VTCLSLSTHTKINDTDQLPRVQGALGQQHTRPCTPVTPDSRLPLFQQTRKFGVELGATSPDGGIILRSCEQSPTRTSTGFPRPLTVQPASPTILANTRVRRSNYGSILLQSPARAGHATQMRRIFQDANHAYHERQLPCSGLYPQLPNVSRKASPPPLRSVGTQGPSVARSPIHRPKSLCLSTRLPSAVPQSRVPRASQESQSVASAGSWSNDSGYIITESRERCSESTLPSKERIFDWIYNISDDEAESSPYDEDHRNAGPQFGKSCIEPHGDNFSTLLERCECQEGGTSLSLCPREQVYTMAPEDQTVINDPFLCHGNERKTIISSQLGPGRPSPSFPIPNHCFSCHLPDICNTLDEDSHKENNQPSPEVKVKSTALPQHHVESSPNYDEVLEEGGVRLSHLSPNVCIERGPSRYHSPRKPHHIENTSTPSKRSYNTHFNTGQLKENVVFREEGTPHLGSPLTPRSNLLGTRFRRAQKSNNISNEKW
jgi:hypothetical protein